MNQVQLFQSSSSKKDIMIYLNNLAKHHCQLELDEKVIVNDNALRQVNFCCQMMLISAIFMFTQMSDVADFCRFAIYETLAICLKNVSYSRIPEFCPKNCFRN